ncbi:unnamed protein product [Nyctereutes procyonoides]|uniref:(raccoon dog) hypothetical protein n=1 Tax=Nyctereutes procyonoides TaxID=34880 RepID=A0A811Y910_NYCPR|nr:unnamed protein product [Nyctereutes procyonoides]
MDGPAFLPSVKKAWDSAEVMLEPQLPLSLSSKNLGPWPLPFYTKLGEPYLCGLLSQTGPQHRHSSRAQNTLEPDLDLSA